MTTPAFDQNDLELFEQQSGRFTRGPGGNVQPWNPVTSPGDLNWRPAPTKSGRWTAGKRSSTTSLGEPNEKPTSVPFEPLPNKILPSGHYEPLPTEKSHGRLYKTTKIPKTQEQEYEEDLKRIEKALNDLLENNKAPMSESDMWVLEMRDHYREEFGIGEEPEPESFFDETVWDAKAVEELIDHITENIIADNQAEFGDNWLGQPTEESRIVAKYLVARAVLNPDSRTRDVRDKPAFIQAIKKETNMMSNRLEVFPDYMNETDFFDRVVVNLADLERITVEDMNTLLDNRGPDGEWLKKLNDNGRMYNIFQSIRGSLDNIIALAVNQEQAVERERAWSFGRVVADMFGGESGNDIAQGKSLITLPGEIIEPTHQVDPNKEIMDAFTRKADEDGNLEFLTDKQLLNKLKSGVRTYLNINWGVNLAAIQGKKTNNEKALLDTEVYLLKEANQIYRKGIISGSTQDEIIGKILKFMDFVMDGTDRKVGAHYTDEGDLVVDPVDLGGLRGDVVDPGTQHQGSIFQNMVHQKQTELEQQDGNKVLATRQKNAPTTLKQVLDSLQITKDELSDEVYKYLLSRAGELPIEQLTTFIANNKDRWTAAKSVELVQEKGLDVNEVDDIIYDAIRSNVDGLPSDFKLHPKVLGELRSKLMRAARQGATVDLRAVMQQLFSSPELVARYPDEEYEFDRDLLSLRTAEQYPDPSAGIDLLNESQRLFEQDQHDAMVVRLAQVDNPELLESITSSLLNSGIAGTGGYSPQFENFIRNVIAPEVAQGYVDSIRSDPSGYNMDSIAKDFMQGKSYTDLFGNETSLDTSGVAGRYSDWVYGAVPGQDVPWRLPVAPAIEAYLEPTVTPFQVEPVARDNYEEGGSFANLDEQVGFNTAEQYQLDGNRLDTTMRVPDDPFPSLDDVRKTDIYQVTTTDPDTGERIVIEPGSEFALDLPNRQEIIDLAQKMSGGDLDYMSYLIGTNDAPGPLARSYKKYPSIAETEYEGYLEGVGKSASDTFLSGVEDPAYKSAKARLDEQYKDKSISTKAWRDKSLSLLAKYETPEQKASAKAYLQQYQTGEGYKPKPFSTYATGKEPDWKKAFKESPVFPEVVKRREARKARVESERRRKRRPTRTLVRT